MQGIIKKAAEKLLEKTLVSKAHSIGWEPNSGALVVSEGRVANFFIDSLLKGLGISDFSCTELKFKTLSISIPWDKLSSEPAKLTVEDAYMELRKKNFSISSNKSEEPSLMSLAGFWKDEKMDQEPGADQGATSKWLRELLLKAEIELKGFAGVVFDENLFNFYRWKSGEIKMIPKESVEAGGGLVLRREVELIDLKMVLRSFMIRNQKNTAWMDLTSPYLKYSFNFNTNEGRFSEQKIQTDQTLTIGLCLDEIFAFISQAPLSCFPQIPQMLMDIAVITINLPSTPFETGPMSISIANFLMNSDPKCIQVDFSQAAVKKNRDIFVSVVRGQWSREISRDKESFLNRENDSHLAFQLIENKENGIPVLRISDVTFELNPEPIFEMEREIFELSEMVNKFFGEDPKLIEVHSNQDMLEESASHSNPRLPFVSSLLWDIHFAFDIRDSQICYKTEFFGILGTVQPNYLVSLGSSVRGEILSQKENKEFLLSFDMDYLNVSDNFSNKYLEIDNMAFIFSQKAIKEAEPALIEPGEESKAKELDGPSAKNEREREHTEVSINFNFFRATYFRELLQIKDSILDLFDKFGELIPRKDILYQEINRVEDRTPFFTTQPGLLIKKDDPASKKPPNVMSTLSFGVAASEVEVVYGHLLSLGQWRLIKTLDLSLTNIDLQIKCQLLPIVFSLFKSSIIDFESNHFCTGDSLFRPLFSGRLLLSSIENTSSVIANLSPLSIQAPLNMIPSILTPPLRYVLFNLTQYRAILSHEPKEASLPSISSNSFTLTQIPSCSYSKVSFESTSCEIPNIALCPQVDGHYTVLGLNNEFRLIVFTLQIFKDLALLVLAHNSYKLDFCELLNQAGINSSLLFLDRFADCAFFNLMRLSSETQLTPLILSPDTSPIDDKESSPFPQKSSSMKINHYLGAHKFSILFNVAMPELIFRNMSKSQNFNLSFSDSSGQTTSYLMGSEGFKFFANNRPSKLTISSVYRKLEFKKDIELQYTSYEKGDVVWMDTVPAEPDSIAFNLERTSIGPMCKMISIYPSFIMKNHSNYKLCVALVYPDQSAFLLVIIPPGKKEEFFINPSFFKNILITEKENNSVSKNMGMSILLGDSWDAYPIIYPEYEKMILLGIKTEPWSKNKNVRMIHLYHGFQAKCDPGIYVDFAHRNKTIPLAEFIPENLKRFYSMTDSLSKIGANVGQNTNEFMKYCAENLVVQVCINGKRRGISVPFTKVVGKKNVEIPVWIESELVTLSLTWESVKKDQPYVKLIVRKATAIPDSQECYLKGENTSGLPLPLKFPTSRENITFIAPPFSSFCVKLPSQITKQKVNEVIMPKNFDCVLSENTVYAKTSEKSMSFLSGLSFSLFLPKVTVHACHDDAPAFSLTLSGVEWEMNMKEAEIFYFKCKELMIDDHFLGDLLAASKGEISYLQQTMSPLHQSIELALPNFSVNKEKLMNMVEKMGLMVQEIFGQVEKVFGSKLETNLHKGVLVKLNEFKCNVLGQEKKNDSVIDFSESESIRTYKSASEAALRLAKIISTGALRQILHFPFEALLEKARQRNEVRISFFC